MQSICLLGLSSTNRKEWFHWSFCNCRQTKIKDLLCDGKLNVLAVLWVCVCVHVFVGGRKWAVLVDTFDLGWVASDSSCHRNSRGQSLSINPPPSCQSNRLTTATCYLHSCQPLSAQHEEWCKWVRDGTVSLWAWHNQCVFLFSALWI